MPRKKSKRKTRIAERDRQRLLESQPVAAQRPRSDRHQLIALAMSSLICGLMLIVNLDRVTHAGADLTIGESRHGWPWVYLTRTLAEIPEIYLPRRLYNWPYPAVATEVRQWNGYHLASDLFVVSIVTVASYYLISGLIWRYDRWRHQ